MSTLCGTFRVSPLTPSFATRIRRDMKDAHGHALAVRRDALRHQCRACLRLTKPGEGFILLSYSPFASDQPYAEVGPIFIHEKECRFDEDAGAYPGEFPREAMVLRAYGAGDEIVDAALVNGRPVEDVIAEFFENPRVAYLHARNGAYGCFMFRIDREEPLERVRLPIAK